LLKLKVRECFVAEELPFKDDSFDGVISLTAVQNFDDIEKAIGEMKRVVRSGEEGEIIVVVSVLKKSSKLSVVDRILDLNFTILKKLEQEKDIIFFCSNSKYA
jgi:ubiquinone/menaquinone biosynthesis C-methylase UbiE